MAWQPFWEKENFEFKPVKLHLKTNHVSHPAHTERLGKYIQKKIRSLEWSARERFLTWDQPIKFDFGEGRQNHEMKKEQMKINKSKNTQY